MVYDGLDVGICQMYRPNDPLEHIAVVVYRSIPIKGKTLKLQEEDGQPITAFNLEFPDNIPCFRPTTVVPLIDERSCHGMHDTDLELSSIAT